MDIQTVLQLLETYGNKKNDGCVKKKSDDYRALHLCFFYYYILTFVYAGATM